MTFTKKIAVTSAKRSPGVWTGWLATALVLAGLLVAPLGAAALPAAREAVIVQAADLDTAEALVRSVGGEVTHELGIIDAVGAQLTIEQRAALQGKPGVRMYRNPSIKVAGKPAPETFYPTLVGAEQLHAQGITGAGVTVAVLDTGTFSLVALNKTPDRQWRLLGQYNAIYDQMDGSRFNAVPTDDNGHGTHVTSVILSSAETTKPVKYNGIAPYANYLSIKAFDADGASSYLDVIRGVDWVVANKDAYNIRILNCSFSALPQSPYWDDPLNQAIMRAWQAGIVVVAAAGNTGPDPMTVGVPGNVPYVITVGAMSDNYTPDDGSDDALASFSAAGPTVEGFVKPDLVAPGGHMLGLMLGNTQIAVEHPEFHDGGIYFTMSGTSQATAVVSGIIALMLQANPSLMPDDVKCRLMASARPALDNNSDLAYSIFQQGAGVVNAYDAVYSTASGCANQGLNINDDLAGFFDGF